VTLKLCMCWYWQTSEIKLIPWFFKKCKKKENKLFVSAICWCSISRLSKVVCWRVKIHTLSLRKYNGQRKTRIFRNNLDLGLLCGKQTWDTTQASAVTNRLLALFILGGRFEKWVDKDMRGSGLDIFSATPIVLVFLAQGLPRRILLCETTILSKCIKDRWIFHLKQKLCLGLFNNAVSSESPLAYRSSFLCSAYHLNKFSSWFTKGCKVLMMN